MVKEKEIKDQKKEKEVEKEKENEERVLRYFHVEICVMFFMELRERR